MVDRVTSPRQEIEIRHEFNLNVWDGNFKGFGMEIVILAAIFD